MSRHAQENLVSLVLLALFGLVLWLCQDYGPRARMIPLPLAVFGILLTLLQLAWHNLGRDGTPQIDMISVDTSAIPGGGDGQPRTERTEEQLGRWGETGAYAIVTALVALVFIAGIFPAAFLFAAAYLILSGYCTPVRGLAYAALMTASMYLLFVIGLEMQPYHGLLAGWMQ
jgi:hypothetical protein